MLMPQVVWILLHLPRDLAHFGEGYWLDVVVYVALQHLQDVETIAGIGDKGREQDVEAVVDG